MRVPIFPLSCGYSAGRGALIFTQDVDASSILVHSAYIKYRTMILWYSKYMINWNARKYTKEEFINAWNESDSISDVARKIGCNASGGGFHTIKSAAKALNLSYDHMTGKSSLSGKKLRRYELSDILIENSDYTTTSSLRLRLIKEGIKESKCEICGISEWMGKSAPLQLDHINGIRTDNRLENLRILCFNCHGQTDTYGSKNRKELYKNKVQPKGLEKSKKCLKCDSLILDCSKFCFKHKSQPKIDWPSVQELLDMLAVSNYTQVGKKLGVSDNAIRKHLSKVSELG